MRDRRWGEGTRSPPCRGDGGEGGGWHKASDGGGGGQSELQAHPVRKGPHFFGSPAYSLKKPHNGFRGVQAQRTRANIQRKTQTCGWRRSQHHTAHFVRGARPRSDTTPPSHTHQVEANEIYSSSYAAAAYLQSIDFPKDKKVYVIGVHHPSPPPIGKASAPVPPMPIPMLPTFQSPSSSVAPVWTPCVPLRTLFVVESTLGPWERLRVICQC